MLEALWCLDSRIESNNPEHELLGTKEDHTWAVSVLEDKNVLKGSSENHASFLIFLRLWLVVRKVRYDFIFLFSFNYHNSLVSKKLFLPLKILKPQRVKKQLTCSGSEIWIQIQSSIKNPLIISLKLCLDWALLKVRKLGLHILKNYAWFKILTLKKHCWLKDCFKWGGVVWGCVCVWGARERQRLREK